MYSQASTLRCGWAFRIKPKKTINWLVRRHNWSRAASLHREQSTFHCLNAPLPLLLDKQSGPLHTQGGASLVPRCSRGCRRPRDPLQTIDRRRDQAPLGGNQMNRRDMNSNSKCYRHAIKCRTGSGPLLLAVFATCFGVQ